jgi:glycerol-3-phosphate cytidylyltransferase
MKVGFTCSCFDLFHAGHIMMLKEAKKQCDYLIVGLQTDPTIDRPEKNKPVQSVFERYVQLEACKYVDEIVVYATEKELIDVLLSYSIDIRIVGDEYREKEFTGKNLPMEIYYNRREHSFSTTELRKRVVEKERDTEKIKLNDYLSEQKTKSEK